MNLSECETTYTGKESLTKWQLDILVILDVLILTVGFCANLSVAYGIVATNQLKNISFKLLFWLSISDCLLAGVTQTLYAIMLSKYADKTYCTFETVVQCCAIFFTHTSAYIIVIIGFDRFARIHFLTRYSRVASKFKIKYILLTVVLVSAAQASIYVLGTQLNFLTMAKKVSVSIDACIAILLFLSYILTIKAMHDHKKKANFQEVLKNVNRSVTKIAARILLCVVAFYVPYLVIAQVHSSLMNKISMNRRRWLSFALLLGYLLTYCNSLGNAFIFLNANKKVRNKLKSKFGVHDNIDDINSSTMMATPSPSFELKNKCYETTKNGLSH